MSLKRLLVAVDGSAMADRAVGVALDLARGLGAALAIVHVVDAGRSGDPDGGQLAAEILEDRRREGVEILRRRLTQASESFAATEILREGDPAQEILAAATTWEADVIVVASHGRSGVARLLMGSIAEQVVRHATIPVLVVPGRVMGLGAGSN